MVEDGDPMIPYTYIHADKHRHAHAQIQTCRFEGKSRRPRLRQEEGPRADDRGSVEDVNLRFLLESASEYLAALCIGADHLGDVRRFSG